PEVLFCKRENDRFFQLFVDKFHTLQLDYWCFGFEFAEEKLKTHFQTSTLKGFGIDGLPLGIVAAGVILHYLQETEHREISHINRIMRLEEDHHVWLDR